MVGPLGTPPGGLLRVIAPGNTFSFVSGSGAGEVTMTDREEYHRVRKALADQAKAMLKNVPANIVLSAFADLTLQMAIEMEKSGDSAAALKRLQEYLAQRLDDSVKDIRATKTIN